MSTRKSAFGTHALSDARNFSLVPGGPLFQILLRAHLIDDALLLLRRRIIVISLLAWLPPLLLSALDGQLIARSVTVPFLLDLANHVRFLVVVPLLLAAELVVHQQLLPVARAFLERNLIPQAAKPRFDAALGSAFRLRNSVAAEVLLLASVYLLGILIVWRRYTALGVSTWYATSPAQGAQLSLAGFWYVYVSLPIFQFLLLRWYFRIFIWARFLWQVSRIQLILVPTHPDQRGGLGFLTDSVYAFILLVVAHGAMLAAHIADRIFFLGAALPEFTTQIAVMVIFLFCLVLGPLLAFAPQLVRARRAGLLEYGAFGERYVRLFDVKWLRGGAPDSEPLLGSSDIQSLADLANSFAVVRAMRPAPVTGGSIIALAAAVLAPVAPLTLTMMPLKELLTKILGVLF
jgi:hypothetical protein